jgi:hypothetical protein
MYKVWIYLFFPFIVESFSFSIIFPCSFSFSLNFSCFVLIVAHNIYNMNVVVKLYYEKIPNNRKRSIIKLQEQMEKAIVQVRKDQVSKHNKRTHSKCNHYLIFHIFNNYIKSMLKKFFAFVQK